MKFNIGAKMRSGALLGVCTNTEKSQFEFFNSTLQDSGNWLEVYNTLELAMQRYQEVKAQFELNGDNILIESENIPVIKIID